MNPNIIPLDEHLCLFNAGQQCDALIGPCACGATHPIEDIQPRIVGLCVAQQRALEVYMQKLDATQQARDFTEQCRKEWADKAIALTEELAALRARTKLGNDL